MSDLSLATMLSQRPNEGGRLPWEEKMSGFKYKWQCQACEKTHVWRDDALECCPPKQIYVCRECGETFQGKGDARKCCEGEGG